MTIVSAPENTPQLEDQGDECQSGQERSLSSAMARAFVRQLAKARKQELDHCWWKGQAARGRYMRVSPYYEDASADVFWYAGFDGLSLEEAVILHDSKVSGGGNFLTASPKGEQA